MKPCQAFVRRTIAQMLTRIPACGPLFALAIAIASAADNGGTFPMDPTAPTGEPYVLMGKRLVFTNWHYVRPGQFAWVNDEGEGVTVSGSEGPWGAHFRRQDYPHGIRIVAQPAQRVGPLLELDRPWEGKGVTIATVIQQGGRYRGWGSCQAADDTRFGCYFESDDGRNWRRPNVGQVEYEGSRENNLLDYSVGTVFVDPSAPEEERYKEINLRNISQEEFEEFKKRRPEAWESRAPRPDVGEIFALTGGVSPDGLRWTRLPEPLVVEHSDTQPVCYYDERLGKYVVYTRNWSVGPRAPGAPDDRGLSWIASGRRSIGRTESADFRHFPLSRIILEPGPDLLPSDTLYTNGKTTIPGAPDHHLMFPTIWHTSDDSTSVAVASSHDGKVWHFLPGSPVLETGPFGHFDGGCIFAHPNLIELPDGSFALPYTGYLFPHKYPRGQWRFQPGMAIWPKGRLVALEAPAAGEFATVAFMPPGRKLLINAVTKRAGSITVEVAALGGAPIAGRTFAEADPIIGDQYRTPVTWQGEDDLGFEEASAIMLRFRLEKAAVFGLDFE